MNVYAYAQCFPWQLNTRRMVWVWSIPTSKHSIQPTSKDFVLWFESQVGGPTLFKGPGETLQSYICRTITCICTYMVIGGTLFCLNELEYGMYWCVLLLPLVHVHSYSWSGFACERYVHTHNMVCMHLYMYCILTHVYL